MWSRGWIRRVNRARLGAGIGVVGVAVVVLAACLPIGGGSTPPTAPTNPIANAPSGTEVDLSWNPSTSSNADHYAITRDGIAIGTTIATALQDFTAVAGKTYLYGISAVSAGGMTSAAANVVALTPGPNAAQVGQWE